MTIGALWLFLTLSCVGLQCVIVVFADHIHLFFMVLIRVLNSCLLLKLGPICNLRVVRAFAYL